MKKYVYIAIVAVLLVIGVYFMIDFYTLSDEIYIDATNIGINNYSREDFYTEYQELQLENKNQGDNDNTSASGNTDVILKDSVLNSTDTSGGNVVSKSEVVMSVIDAMKKEGYNDYAICGVIGNMTSENPSFNPGSTQGHKKDNASNEEILGWVGNSGRAIGIVQWDSGRATALVQEAINQGKPWYDLKFQVDYLMADMPNQRCSVDKFNEKATNLEYATYWFVSKFERCGVKDNNFQTSEGKPVTCASQLSYEQRSYALGWETRFQGAKDAYATYFNN